MEILHFMVKRWLSRVNGNPKDKEETDLNSTSVTAMNMDKAKMVDVLVTNERRIAIAKHFEPWQCIQFSAVSWFRCLVVQS